MGWGCSGYSEISDRRPLAGKILRISPLLVGGVRLLPEGRR
jgi:hypothetical protein